MPSTSSPANLTLLSLESADSRLSRVNVSSLSFAFPAILPVFVYCQLRRKMSPAISGKEGMFRLNVIACAAAYLLVLPAVPVDLSASPSQQQPPPNIKQPHSIDRWNTLLRASHTGATFLESGKYPDHVATQGTTGQLTHQGLC